MQQASLVRRALILVLGAELVRNLLTDVVGTNWQKLNTYKIFRLDRGTATSTTNLAFPSLHFRIGIVKKIAALDDVVKLRKNTFHFNRSESSELSPPPNT